MDEEDQPIWVVYRLKKLGLLRDCEPFLLQTTTKEVWETMMRGSLGKAEAEAEVIAEDVTYETANKMIGLTKG